MTQPVYLHVELKIAAAKRAAFLATMQEVAPLMMQSGWKLLGAWQTRLGRHNLIRVIWELPDANTYFRERKALVEHPRFAEFREVLEAAVEEEATSLMVRIPYGEVAATG